MDVVLLRGSSWTQAISDKFRCNVVCVDVVYGHAYAPVYKLVEERHLHRYAQREVQRHVAETCGRDMWQRHAVETCGRDMWQKHVHRYVH